MNIARRLQRLLTGRLRTIGVVLCFLVLAIVVKLAELSITHRYFHSWDHISDERAHTYLTDAKQEFHQVQRSTRRFVTEVVQRPEVNSLADSSRESRALLFDFLTRMNANGDIGLEVFDRRGALVAWAGRSGGRLIDEVRIALGGHLTSFVIQSGVTSWLFVAAPIAREHEIIGAIIGWQAVEVEYPLNTQLVKHQGISLSLTEKYGVPIEFDFSRTAEPRKDGRYLSEELLGINGARVGVVSVMRPSRSNALDQISRKFDFAHSTLLAAGVLIVAIFAMGKVLLGRSVLLAGILITAIVWCTRFIFLFLEFPSAFLESGIFDPSYFASKWGAGLARSIGEMSLTSIALVANTILVLRVMLKKSEHESPWWQPSNPIVRIGIIVASTVVLYLLLRGYGASIRSVIFDSTLQFTDPRVIIPSFELGLMVFNLFALSFCLIIVAVGITSFNMTLAPEFRAVRGWVLIAFLYGVASVLFDVLQPNPLMSTWYRLFFGAAVLVFTFRLHSVFNRAGRLATANNLLAVFALSAAFFYPQLVTHVHEKDRSRIEAFAAEAIRPVDSWLSLVVNEALQEFVSDESLDFITSGRPADLGRVAFRCWTQSAIAKEGYTTRFSFVDSAGNILSRFSLGGQAVLGNPENETLGQELEISVHEAGSGISTTKVYSGSIPVFGLDGRLLGWGIVSLAAGQKSLFRGDNPTIVRNVVPETLEPFYHSLVVSQYAGDTLAFSTDVELPLGMKLPRDVQSRLGDNSDQFVWGRELVGESSWETLFIRQPNTGDIIGLGVRRPGIWWHLFNVVKVIVYYTFVGITALAGLLLVQFSCGKPYRFKFRDKLLGAMLVATIVPIAVLAIFGRQSVRERHMESIRTRLAQETSVITALLQPILSAPGDTTTLISDATIEKIAEDAKTDFNVYRGKELLKSSRPELYETGILNRRLDGVIYGHVFEKRNRFFIHNESVGGRQYAVGYAPLFDAIGGIFGVVSVPLLYRQESLDEEVSRQDALLFGVYACVVFMSIGFATTIANRIAAPIHRLTKATKRVARGDLDGAIPETESDGEIGELVKSFGEMTRDLKKNRSELVQFERELAWKEMAKQVAHEIRNPLTPMKLSLQHLRQAYHDKSKQFGEIFDEVSQTIIQQIDALDRIASEFSRFARMPRAKLEQCDVNILLHEAAQLFEQEKAVKFEIHLEQDLPMVLADKQELRRAFINIIRNGIQAMNGNGTVTLRSRHEDGSVIAGISDHGTGIAPEIMEKLFEPNFSTKTDGMGLGLAIVKKTVEDLGGSIGVKSEMRKGTTMSITLPVKSS